MWCRTGYPSINTASTNNQIEHLTVSESSISDVEITTLIQPQILAQANIRPQSALALLTSQFGSRFN